MMKYPALILAVFLFLNPAVAHILRGADGSISNSEYVPVATLEVPAMMKTAELIGKYGNTAFPELANWIMLGVVTVGMSPQLSDFMVTAPISFSIFHSKSRPVNDPDRFVLCISTEQKRKTVPSSVRFLNYKFYPVPLNKDFRVLLVSSKNFAANVKPEHISRPSSEDPGSFTFTFNRKSMGDSFSVADFLFPYYFQNENIDLSSSPEASEWLQGVKAKRFKFEKLDEFLKNYDEYKVKMSSDPDALNLEITMTGGNQASTPKSVRSTPYSFRSQVPENTVVAACVSLDSIADYHNFLIETFESYPLENSEPENSALLYTLMPQAAKGHLFGYAGTVRGAFFSGLEITVDSSRTQEIAKALQKSKRSKVPFLWIVREYRLNPAKVYCYNHPNNPDKFVFYYSNLDESEIGALLKTNTAFEMQMQGVARAVEVSKQKPGTENLLSVDRENGNVSLKLRMEPETLNSFLFLIQPLF